MTNYTDNINFINTTQFVNDTNLNKPLSELDNNVKYILNFINGNKALLSGVYGNLWDYDASGRRVLYNGGLADTYKKVNTWIALNDLQMANDDEIIWDRTNSRTVYKGQSVVTVDRPKWIEREIWIPETLRDQKLVFILKAAGCTDDQGWDTTNTVCETIAIQILGGSEDVQTFRDVGHWVNHPYYSNDSYDSPLTTVVVPFKAAKNTSSVKVRIFRTINTGYLHIDRVFVGGLCLPYDNVTESYDLSGIDINEFYDFKNVCTKVTSASIMGHKVADTRSNLKGNDVITWYQFNYVMRELLTYGSVFTTTTTNLSGSPSQDNWSQIVVPDLYSNMQGKVTCNTSNRTYRVNHPVLENPSAPLLTLTMPTSSSQLFIQGLFDVATDHFNVILSDVPSETGYTINWNLGNAFNPRNAIDSLDLPDETPSIECPAPTSYPSIFNYESNV